MLALTATATGLRLVTRTRLPGIRPENAHAFLATPANWPAVVLSSHSVAPVDSVPVDRPLKVGEAVDEIFGLPPVLPLSVRWTCAAADARAGTLRMVSAEGVGGVATDCAMDFAITPSEGDGCELELTMTYAPASPLATLAAPILAIDNAVALRLLLPCAIAASPPAETLVATRRVGAPRMSAAEAGDSDADAPKPRLSALSRLGAKSAEAPRVNFNQVDIATRIAEMCPRYGRDMTPLTSMHSDQVNAETAAGEFDAAAIDARLDAALDGAKASGSVLIFSTTTCPFCSRAKELLESKGAKFESIELDTDPNGKALRARLGARTGRTSVPSVWIGGECVGGLNDGPGLVPLDADGELEPRLRSAGAMA